MREKLGNFWDFISSASQNRTVALLAILVVAAAVPLTVLVAQKQQSFQQKADSSYCYAQTNPNFCTAANGCQWSESASIPVGQIYQGGASSGGCIPLSTSSTTPVVTQPPATSQPAYSCEGNQICVTSNGSKLCNPCTNGATCVMNGGTPTCSGGTTTTPPSSSTGTPSCTIAANPTTVNSGGSTTLYINTQNTGGLGSCRLVDQNGTIQDPTNLSPFTNPPSWTIKNITQNSVFSLQCPVGTTLCSTGMITVSGATTGTGTTTTPPATASGCNPACTGGQVCGSDNQCHTSTDPKQCSITNLGCDFTSNTSCLPNIKSDSNCFNKYSAFAICTGNTSAAAAQQAQSVCGNSGSTTATTFKRADVNHDTNVDLMDYNILISCMTGFTSYNSSTCGSFAGNADIDKSGAVDQIDYNTWLRIYRGVDPNN